MKTANDLLILQPLFGSIILAFLLFGIAVMGFKAVRCVVVLVRNLQNARKAEAVKPMIQAAREYVIELHMHPEERVYYLGKLDHVATQEEIDSIKDEAKNITVKHPLGMNT
jgi:hypothetical protein